VKGWGDDAAGWNKWWRPPRRAEILTYGALRDEALELTDHQLLELALAALEETELPRTAPADSAVQAVETEEGEILDGQHLGAREPGLTRVGLQDGAPEHRTCRGGRL
jgi:hypothetical protein